MDREGCERKGKLKKAVISAQWKDTLFALFETICVLFSVGYNYYRVKFTSGPCSLNKIYFNPYSFNFEQLRSYGFNLVPI